MKRKSFSHVVLLILFMTFVIGSFANISVYGAKTKKKTQDLKTKKETQNLKKLYNKVKKKKTGNYKTKSPAWDDEQMQHKASIYRKGKNIYFTDTIKTINIKENSTQSIHIITMPLKTGINNKVTVTIKGTEYSQTYDENGNYIESSPLSATTFRTTLTPKTYYPEMVLKYKIIKKGESNDDTSFLWTYLDRAFYCWNKMAKKYAKVTMKSIGFRQYK